MSPDGVTWGVSQDTAAVHTRPRMTQTEKGAVGKPRCLPGHPPKSPGKTVKAEIPPLLIVVGLDFCCISESRSEISEAQDTR